MRILVTPGGIVAGEARVPGNKSIAHRMLLLAAIASGRSVLRGLPAGLDVAATAGACAALLPGAAPDLGAWMREVERRGWDEPEVEVGHEVEVEGAGRRGLRPTSATIDCRNSGTSMRLLAGLLAAAPFQATLDGDASLRARPMERVAEPLRRMGAGVETTDGRPPVVIRGGPLAGIRFETAVPSAQVKGAVLLAGIAAEGMTEVVEPAPTRDHTERMLSALGAPVRSTLLDGGSRAARSPEARDQAGLQYSVTVEPFEVPAFTAGTPGDVSSAAFLAGAAVLTGGSVTVPGLGLNPSRLRFLEVLARMGARVHHEAHGEELGEPVGTLRVEGGRAPTGTVVTAGEQPLLLDEIPLLAVVASAAQGETRFEGAGELRVKESDRLMGLRDLLRGLGGDADVTGDTLVVAGGGLRGGVADARGDHRMAMAAVVGACAARGPSEVRGAEAAAVSFPGFAEAMRRLGARLEVAS
ncbi:MAG: 3-phosphoshikimate 1-carboxyvinyltransferase [Actinomycetota bacterium]